MCLPVVVPHYAPGRYGASRCAGISANGTHLPAKKGEEGGTDYAGVMLMLQLEGQGGDVQLAQCKPLLVPSVRGFGGISGGARLPLSDALLPHATHSIDD